MITLTKTDGSEYNVADAKWVGECDISELGLIANSEDAFGDMTAIDEAGDRTIDTVRLYYAAMAEVSEMEGDAESDEDYADIIDIENALWGAFYCADSVDEMRRAALELGISVDFE